MPPTDNTASICFEGSPEIFGAIGKLIWQNRSTYNEKMQAVYQFNRFSAEPKPEDYFDLGVKFLAHCRAAATAQDHYQFYGIVVARVLELVDKKLVDCKAGECFSTSQAGCSETGTSEVEIIAGFLKHNCCDLPLRSEIVTLWQRPGFSADELARLRNYAKGATTPPPSTLKSQLSAARFIDAVMEDAEHPIPGRAEQLFRYLIELLGRIDAVDQDVLAKSKAEAAEVTASASKMAARR